MALWLFLTEGPSNRNSMCRTFSRITSPMCINVVKSEGFKELTPVQYAIPSRATVTKHTVKHFERWDGLKVKLATADMLYSYSLLYFFLHCWHSNKTTCRNSIWLCKTSVLLRAHIRQPCQEADRCTIAHWVECWTKKESASCIPPHLVIFKKD